MHLLTDKLLAEDDEIKPEPSSPLNPFQTEF